MAETAKKQDTQTGHPFVAYLVGLREKEDRGSLAALRRGLGKPPGSVAETHRYVVPFTGHCQSRWQEDCHYIIASLFGLHPEHAPELRNLGESFARVRAREPDNSSMEQRFTALLGSHRDDLPERLRSAVALLKSKDIGVNYDGLFKDLQYWDHPDKFVQRNWAKSFWAEISEDSKDHDQSEK